MWPGRQTATVFACACMVIDTKMAVNSLKLSLPSLSDEPHHPKNVEFPKRTFGKLKPVLCSAQSCYDDVYCDARKVPFQQTGSVESACGVSP